MKIYIAGKIAGDPSYREKFAQAQRYLETQGYIVLNPAQLPGEMQAADYMRICFAMMDSAGVVAFLPDCEQSRGAQLEWAWCQYVDKQTMYLVHKEGPAGRGGGCNGTGQMVYINRLSDAGITAGDRADQPGGIGGRDGLWDICRQNRGEEGKITNQEKKKELLRYRICEKEIARIEEEIERWESRAQKCTASYHLAPGGGGDDRIQAAVDEIAELRAELYDRLLDEKRVRERIQAAIRTVPDNRLRLLLEYRYIDGMRWEEVAVKMELSWQHIHRMHAKALDVIVCDIKSVV